MLECKLVDRNRYLIGLFPHPSETNLSEIVLSWYTRSIRSASSVSRMKELPQRSPRSRNYKLVHRRSARPKESVCGLLQLDSFQRLTSCRPPRWYPPRSAKDSYPSSIHDEKVVIEPARPEKEARQRSKGLGYLARMHTCSYCSIQRRVARRR